MAALHGPWAAVAVAVLVVASALGALAVPRFAVGRSVLASSLGLATPSARVPPYLEASYPPALIEDAMAYDVADGYTLMFGGFVGEIGSTAPNDTWVFLNTTWYRLTSPVEPPASSLVRMAYDPAGRDVLLYEGVAGGTQTWSYSAGNWTNLTGSSGVAGPAGFSFYSMDFDSGLNEVVLAGIEPNSHGSNLTQVIWGISPGGRWQNVTDVPAVWAEMLGWDPTNSSLMFAGCTNVLSFGSGGWTVSATPVANRPCLGVIPGIGPMNTWDPSVPAFLVITPAFAYEYNGSWKMLPQVLPSPSSYGALTYDDGSAAAIEFGGFAPDNGKATATASDTTWLFAHGNWTALPIPTSPSSSLAWIVILAISAAAVVVILAMAIILWRRRGRAAPPQAPKPAAPPPR
jgi:hypothetical protein